MPTLVTALHLGILALAVDGTAPHRESPEAETLHRLLAEFDAVRRTSPPPARPAEGDKGRASAGSSNPATQAFARKFLELARTSKDEETAVRALVWVIGYGGKGPEGDEAFRMLEGPYLRNDAVAGACRPLAIRGAEGERRLLRIVDEHPKAGVRGMACLGLAFARSQLQREVQRYRGTPPERLPLWTKVYGQDRVKLFATADPAALIAETERWLERMLDEFPDALVNEGFPDFLPFLAGNLGPATDRILRKVSESHSSAKTRSEAECALVLRQMRLARLAAEDRAAARAGRPPSGGEDFPGGPASLRTVDPRPLTGEITRRLRGLADRMDELADAWPYFVRVLREIPASLAYHTDSERLLRRAAEEHPNGLVRSNARRVLMLYFGALSEESARLKSASETELARWVDLLGKDRVEEIQRMSPDRLIREAMTQADLIAAEGRDRQGTPDRELEAFRRTFGRAPVGTVAPEIEGTDLDGVALKLSDFRGRVVVLDFWNHRTCPHCRAAYPVLRNLIRRFAGRPFTLLGVDTDDDRDALAQLVKDGTITWRFWFTHGTTEDSTFARWGIQGVPNVIVVDARGIIRVRYEGTPDHETLDKAIEALIKEVEVAPDPGE